MEVALQGARDLLNLLSDVNQCYLGVSSIFV